MRAFNRLLIAGLAGVTLFTTLANAQDVEAGRIVAQRYCSTCHEIRKNPAYSEMAPSFAEIARKPVATSGALNAFLSEPHDRMPNYLMRQEISDVSAYILSLNRP
jgi:mono/diheme cytochrome c family protein